MDSSSSSNNPPSYQAKHSKHHHSKHRPPHSSSQGFQNQHRSSSQSSHRQHKHTSSNQHPPSVDSNQPATVTPSSWSAAVKEGGTTQRPQPASSAPTSNTAPSQQVDYSKEYGWLIGTWIQVKTISDEELEGQVYAFDASCGILVLQTPSLSQRDPSLPLSSTRKFDFSVLKMPFIKSFSPLSTPPNKYLPYITPMSDLEDSKLSTLIPMAQIPLDKIKARQMEGIRNMEERIAKIGVGVSKDAQDIFDALGKTMECRWHEQTIVVMELVLIPPPYRVEDCKGTDNYALMRVKKVLEGERKRLKLTDQPLQPHSNPKPATTGKPNPPSSTAASVTATSTSSKPQPAKPPTAVSTDPSAGRMKPSSAPTSGESKSSRAPKSPPASSVIPGSTASSGSSATNAGGGGAWVTKGKGGGKGRGK